ncbi:MAG: hypothetical protein U0353_29040, partial [Sandaracinus sp.]
MRPLVLTLVTAGLVLAAPLAASADVVESPPASCPTGSTPSTGHSGPYCAPTESCAVGGVCPNGASCVPLRQCIETRPCGGWTPPDAALCTIQNVIGPCASDGTCAAGVCTERNVFPVPGPRREAAAAAWATRHRRTLGSQRWRCWVCSR